MTELSWGVPGERFYEAGVDRGVLYVEDVGVAWNGLISVQENSSGGDPQPYYVDGYKYANIVSSEEFEATVEALSAPSEFGVCDGTVELMNGLFITQQRRKKFSLSYRTLIGNDTEATELGYKIHLVYNALAAPSERNNQSIQATATPTSLSWALTTVPPKLAGYKPTAHYIIDSTKTDPEDLSALEDILYGTESEDATMPTPEDLIELFS